MNPSLGVINNLMSCQTKFFTSTKSWGRATVEVKQLSTNWKVGNSIPAQAACASVLGQDTSVLLWQHKVLDLRY